MDPLGVNVGQSRPFPPPEQIVQVSVEDLVQKSQLRLYVNSVSEDNNVACLFKNQWVQILDGWTQLY